MKYVPTCTTCLVEIFKSANIFQVFKTPMIEISLEIMKVNLADFEEKSIRVIYSDEMLGTYTTVYQLPRGKIFFAIHIIYYLLISNHQTHIL